MWPGNTYLLAQVVRGEGQLDQVDGGKPGLVPAPELGEVAGPGPEGEVASGVAGWRLGVAVELGWVGLRSFAEYP